MGIVGEAALRAEFKWMFEMLMMDVFDGLKGLEDPKIVYWFYLPFRLNGNGILSFVKIPSLPLNFSSPS
jgi:hypothetical protein